MPCKLEVGLRAKKAAAFVLLVFAFHPVCSGSMGRCWVRLALFLVSSNDQPDGKPAVAFPEGPSTQYLRTGLWNQSP